MKVEIRDNEIELVPETDRDRDALSLLSRHQEVRLKDGRTTSNTWPPDPRKTSIVICLPDPNNWGS